MNKKSFCSILSFFILILNSCSSRKEDTNTSNISIKFNNSMSSEVTKSVDLNDQVITGIMLNISFNGQAPIREVWAACDDKPLDPCDRVVDSPSFKYQLPTGPARYFQAMIFTSSKSKGKTGAVNIFYGELKKDLVLAQEQIPLVVSPVFSKNKMNMGTLMGRYFGPNKETPNALIDMYIHPLNTPDVKFKIMDSRMYSGFLNLFVLDNIGISYEIEGDDQFNSMFSFISLSNNSGIATSDALMAIEVPTYYKIYPFQSPQLEDEVKKMWIGFFGPGSAGKYLCFAPDNVKIDNLFLDEQGKNPLFWGTEIGNIRRIGGGVNGATNKECANSDLLFSSIMRFGPKNFDTHEPKSFGINGPFMINSNDNFVSIDVSGKEVVDAKISWNYAPNVFDGTTGISGVIVYQKILDSQNPDNYKEFDKIRDNNSYRCQDLPLFGWSEVLKTDSSDINYLLLNNYDPDLLGRSFFLICPYKGSNVYGQALEVHTNFGTQRQNYLGGQVSGIIGSIKIQLNGQEILLVSNNGSFVFAQGLYPKMPYFISVDSPDNQICTIENDKGIMFYDDISNIKINCIPAYKISVSIQGSNDLVFIDLNDGQEILNLGADGIYSFFQHLPEGTKYKVSILDSNNQTCSIINNTGTIAKADINNIVVDCSQEFQVGGFVSGLTEDLTLKINQEDPIALTSMDSNFTFPTSLTNGSAYFIQVVDQPTTQFCVVSNPSGVINNTNVNNVQIICQNKLTLSGTAYGQPASLIISVNGSEQLSINQATFSFTDKFIPGESYNIEVVSNTAGSYCYIGNRKGVFNTTNVTNVFIQCTTQMDTTFGTNGVVTLGSASTNNKAFDISQGAAAAYFVGGSEDNSMFIYGLSANGDPYTTWNGTGALQTTLLGEGRPTYIQTLPCDNIFTFGRDTTSTKAIMYQPDGTVQYQANFQLPSNPTIISTSKIAAKSNNTYMLYVASTINSTTNSCDYQSYIAKFNMTLGLDSTFGSGGISSQVICGKITDIKPHYDSYYNVTEIVYTTTNNVLSKISENGAVIFNTNLNGTPISLEIDSSNYSYYILTSVNNIYYITKTTSSGTIIFTTPLSPNISANSTLSLKDMVKDNVSTVNRLTFVGHLNNGANKDFFMTRYIIGTNGISLDTSFNNIGNGISGILMRSGDTDMDSYPEQIIVDYNYKYVVVGHGTNSATDSDSLVWRINP